MNRKTAAFFFLRLRESLSLELEAQSEAMFGREIEVDESYFGGARKGKQGRGAAGKMPWPPLHRCGEGRRYRDVLDSPLRASGLGLRAHGQGRIEHGDDAGGELENGPIAWSLTTARRSPPSSGLSRSISRLNSGCMSASFFFGSSAAFFEGEK